MTGFSFRWYLMDADNAELERVPLWKWVVRLAVLMLQVRVRIEDQFRDPFVISLMDLWSMIFAADRPHPPLRRLDALRRHEPVVRAQGARGAPRRPRGAREREAGAAQVM